MKNRINQIVKLDDGNQYVILRQAIYKNESYFIVSKLDKDLNPIADDLTFFHQIEVNSQLKFKKVTDINLMQYLYTYMKI